MKAGEYRCLVYHNIRATCSKCGTKSPCVEIRLRVPFKKDLTVCNKCLIEWLLPKKPSVRDATGDFIERSALKEEVCKTIQSISSEPAGSNLKRKIRGRGKGAKKSNLT